MRTLLPSLSLFLCLAAAAVAQDVAGLTKQLKSKDADVRRSAAKALAEVGKEAKAAVPELSRALKDEDAFVRRFAAQALGAIGPDAKAAVSALQGALGDAKKEVGEAAADALGKIGPAAVSALSDVIKDKKKDESVRRRAVESVGKMGAEGKPAVAALTEALRERGVRLEAVTALGNIGPEAKAALPTLKEMSMGKEQDKVFRNALAVAIKKIDKK